MKKVLIATGLLAGCAQTLTVAIPNPENGLSCSVEEVFGGAIIQCEDGTVAQIRNGERGPEGQQGPQGEQGIAGPVGPQGLPGTPAEGTYVSKIIDPCGPSGGVDEVLLVMSDGAIVAWYNDLGLVVLAPGRYRTTDAQRCVFEIDTNGQYSE